MLVRDWMTPDPFTVLPTTPVMEALNSLSQRGFRRLPVVDEGGGLIGITTRKDLRDAVPSKAATLSIWEINFLLSKLTVGEMMAKPVLTAQVGEYMEDAALRMRQRGVGGLPVLDDRQRLCGILTVGDVLEAFTHTLGQDEGGQRLYLRLPDVPGSLEQAARAVQPSNIISLATSGAAQGQREFVMRVVGEAASSAGQRLRDAGFEVE
ncbi:CBS domain-containing protein [Deinococcus detaillensis]|uniref:CBS domain-containing protein n=1 Tax=Deinococcus detaillensis TaxID=2592048 RepID=A0A553V084_9DEIO|nr:CBS domain-containing protein [Deinococcus detaillensis]TSA85860.1 CBS domain-containing protein [Deinococcus detaillensis]